MGGLGFVLLGRFLLGEQGGESSDLIEEFADEGLQFPDLPDVVGVSVPGRDVFFRLPECGMKFMDLLVPCGNLPLQPFDLVEEVARQYKIKQVCRTYEELLDTPGLDAVSIVTPPYQHHELTLAAFAAGNE